MVAVPAADVFAVPPMCALGVVGCQLEWGIEPDLVGDIPLGVDRYVAWVLEKGPEKTHRAQLQREPESVLVPAPLLNPRQIHIV
jgi:hypothetical protein